MPGRVAGVHRELLEPVDLRTMTVDDERRRAIRARLDGQREEQEPGQPPVLCGRRDHRGDAGDDRQDDAAGHDRADERRVCQTRPIGGRQEADELSSSTATPWTWSKGPGHEEPRCNRERGDDGERDEYPGQVGPDGMAGAGQCGQATPEASRLLIEHRESQRGVAVSFLAGTGVPEWCDGIDGHAVRVPAVTLRDRLVSRTTRGEMLCFSFARIGNIAVAARPSWTRSSPLPCH